MQQIWQIAGAVIAAFGGSALILVACSTFLGRVWAARILEQDRAKYAREIEGLRSEAGQELARLTTQLDTLKHTELRIHSDKLVSYRAAIDVVADIVRILEKHHFGQLAPLEVGPALERFYKARLQLYGYLGILAPQSVMDAQDVLMEFLFDVIEGKRTGDWAEMRVRALELINEIRKDVGIDKTPIEYRGAR